jgi:OmpA-OmpF porin, OOP family
MNKTFATLTAATLLGLVGAVQAAGDDPGAWTVGGQGIWTAAANDRNLDDAGGGQLSLGHVLNERWNLGVNAFTSHHSVTNTNDSDDLRGLGIELDRVFHRESKVKPFVGIGTGLLEADNAPSSQKGLFATLGGGFIGDLAQFSGGNKLQLRGDAALRHFPKPGLHSAVTDLVFGLGLQLGFGGTPAPAPVVAVAPPPPPPAAPAPPPPPADDDHDGVPNSVDKCPNTAPNTPVDAVGCDLDSDKDGVPNATDKCPDTPAGDRVDTNGCSLRATLKVFFETNSAVLKAESYPELDTMAKFLNDVPTATGVLEGHTDSQGADAYNQALSQRRADSVRKYLMDKGVAGGRLQAKGFGETQPEADNKTAEGRAANRRVVFQRTDVK